MTDLPTEDAAPRQAAELRLIGVDVHWAWRFAWDATGGAALAIPGLCLTSPLSLIVYESRRYLANIDPTLPLRYAEFIERARHRIKLFDDNQQGMEGVIGYAEAVIAAHRSHFAGLTGNSTASRSTLAKSMTDSGYMHRRRRTSRRFLELSEQHPRIP